MKKLEKELPGIGICCKGISIATSDKRNVRNFIKGWHFIEANYSIEVRQRAFYLALHILNSCTYSVKQVFAVVWICIIGSCPLFRHILFSI